MCELTSLIVKCDQGSNAGLLALRSAATESHVIDANRVRESGYIIQKC